MTHGQLHPSPLGPQRPPHAIRSSNQRLPEPLALLQAHAFLRCRRKLPSLPCRPLPACQWQSVAAVRIADRQGLQCAQAPALAHMVLLRMGPPKALKTLESPLSPQVLPWAAGCGRQCARRWAAWRAQAPDPQALSHSPTNSKLPVTPTRSLAAGSLRAPPCGAGGLMRAQAPGTQALHSRPKTPTALLCWRQAAV